jgi:hypothetical protein
MSKNAHSPGKVPVGRIEPLARVNGTLESVSATHQKAMGPRRAEAYDCAEPFGYKYKDSTSERFTIAWQRAKEKGDWLPARVPLIPFGRATGGREPVPFFRAPAERKPL